MPVVSPIRAAGFLPINTVDDPLTIVSGWGGGPLQSNVSPMRAAGNLPIKTVGQPNTIIPPPACGIGGTPGVTMGHMCLFDNTAAGGTVKSVLCVWVN